MDIKSRNEQASNHSTQFTVTASDVREMAEELAKAASHPEFLKLIHEVQESDGPHKVAVAKANARVDEVSARGIPLPQTFRVTTRTFEDPVISDEDLEGSHPDAPVVAFSGERGYVSYNGTTIMVAAAGSESSGAIRREIQKGIQAIGDFVTSPPFQNILALLAEQAADARADFIGRELLDPVGREKWHLVLPEGMHIQRSEFADGRPTLFCVTKVLPFAHPWHKVTITFDDAIV